MKNSSKSKKGVFITFEGIDGCGKTTQQQMSADFLNSLNLKTLLTREPGSGEVGAKIREIVLHHKGFVSNLCELFLYLADRAQHVDTVIKPALTDGYVVLCDRYVDSTVCYQGFGRGGDVSELEKLNKSATGGLLPDLTIVYDIDVKTAQTRLGKEKDRLEGAGIEFQEKVKNGYLKLAEQNQNRIVVINANLSIDEVFEETKKCIEKLIEKDNQ